MNPIISTHPQLLKEWDYAKNDNIHPEEVSYGSGKKVWWKCVVCSYSWCTAVYVRTKGCGCPACAGRAVNKYNNLNYLFPTIAKEFNSSRNSVTPENVVSGSHKKVWWVCSTCGFEWIASVQSRTLLGTGCPVCARQKVSFCNNLCFEFPRVAAEWDEFKNDVYPDEVMSKADQKAWWVCSICGFEWKAFIYKRAQGNNCPQCARGMSVSKASQIWLDYIGIPDVNREIRVDFNDGSYIIVDGYDPETNTIYEFLGDYWHGNPDKYECKQLNKKIGRTFGDLYNDWEKRRDKLINLGYRVVHIWEKDFRKEVSDV